MAPPLPLLFLRPLPPPRPQYIHRFLRQITTTRPKSPYPPCSPQTPILTAAADSTYTSPSTSPAVAALAPLSYHVHRTASQQLPVYQLAKRGGNLHQTKIRKIEGRVEDLRDELRRVLGLKEEQVVVNQLTKHIIIKVGLDSACGVRR